MLTLSQSSTDVRLNESFVILVRDLEGATQATKMSNSLHATDPTQNGKLFRALTTVWELASERIERDLPLCIECCQKVVDEQDRRSKELDDECKAYEELLTILSQQNESAASNQLNDEQISAQEKDIEAQLEGIRLQKSSLLSELDSLQRESDRLDELESRFWEEYRDFEMQLDKAFTERNAINQKLRVYSDQLQQLKRTNVFDDSFFIYYEGHFGTINGFRLGRLPSQPVDWPEINAALGQTVLLLDTIARHVRDFEFTKCQLIPKGSYSRICLKSDSQNTFELYGSSDLSLGRLFWYRRFDTAMVLFVSCLKELGEFAEINGHRVLQYPIHEDTIKGLSVKLQFNQDEKWTKALKFLLINLKYLLAWCARQNR